MRPRTHAHRDRNGLSSADNQAGGGDLQPARPGDDDVLHPVVVGDLRCVAAVGFVLDGHAVSQRVGIRTEVPAGDHDAELEGVALDGDWLRAERAAGGADQGG